MDSTDIESHLVAASDAVVLLHAEVGQLERHKRAMDPTDPRFGELAAAVRTAAQALLDFSAGEEEWTRTAVASVSGPLRPIAESPNEPSLLAILERWRAVERELGQATPGSPEAKRLFAEFERLRDEYMAAFQAHEAQGTEGP